MRDRLLRLIQCRFALLFPIPFWALVVGLLYYHNDRTLQHAGFDLAMQRGEVAFELVQVMRSWNAGHGGVYAPLTEATPENPWLEVPEKTITSPEGVVLTTLNPAYMTRQIADMLSGGELEIHLTSRKLMNPNNRPDPWERQALIYLEQESANSVVDIVDDRFRYMAPLHIEQGCMACHATMGYELGDMRGGLSVSFPISYAHRLTSHLRRDSIVIHLMAFVLLSVTGMAALLGLRRLLGSLQGERDDRESIIVERTASLQREIKHHRRSQEALTYLAHHDELTSAYNRRRILGELTRLQQEAAKHSRPLSLLMLDIDYFKRINDTFGHQIGDEVLVTFVSRLKNELRESDRLGRYGGEEFIVLLPGTPESEAEQVAERLRHAIADTDFKIEGQTLNVSASVGLATTEAEVVVTQDQLIGRADEALYRAKESGRNRVVRWAEEI